MTVMIATPHYGAADPHWFDNFLQLDKPERWVRASVVRRPVAYARNLLVTAMFEPDHFLVRTTVCVSGGDLADCASADWLFFWDDDTLLPADGLTRLLAHNQPIVSGLYWSRTPPYLPTVFRFMGETPTPEGQAPRLVPLTRYVGGLQQVDAVGAGCLLIRRDVFERVPQPWFDGRSESEIGAGVGEDIWFCVAAQRAGYTVLLDGDLHCRHLGVLPIGKQESVRYNARGLHFPTEEYARLATEVRPWPPQSAAQ